MFSNVILHPFSSNFPIDIRFAFISETYNVFLKDNSIIELIDSTFVITSPIPLTFKERPTPTLMVDFYGFRFLNISLEHALWFVAPESKSN